MTKFTIVTETSADDIAKPNLTALKEKFGLLPNFFGALGINGRRVC